MSAAGTPHEPLARHVPRADVTVARERAAERVRERADTHAAWARDPGVFDVRIEIDPREVVFVKSLIEASEGLASIFAVRGGSLTLVASASRRSTLLELVEDLARDHGARVLPEETDAP